MEPLLKETNNKMEALDKKYSKSIELILDLEYKSLKPELLVEIVNNTLKFMPKNNLVESRRYRVEEVSQIQIIDMRI